MERALCLTRNEAAPKTISGAARIAAAGSAVAGL
jgi:hypothetical protein